MNFFASVKGRGVFGRLLLTYKLLIAMKLVVLLTFVAVLEATAGSYAQRITLKAKNIPLAQALDEVHVQSGYQIFLNGKTQGQAVVDVALENASLEEAMDALLEGRPLEWTIKGNTIIIRPDNGTGTAPQPSRVAVSAQARTIEGKVSGTGGVALEGATVAVKGTAVATTTGADGTYRINVPDGGSVLVFSIVGYQQKEMSIGSSSVVNVTLSEQITDLEEVVVTGYSTEQKKDIVGSVSVVDADALASTPSSSVSNQLQGLAAGVNVSATGDIGGGAKVRIRGFGSFTGSDPLYIVDGVPMSGGIDNLNPNDIESLQVLKDASSASIYGARAANGVVIITTKTGKSGPVKVSASAYGGINYTEKSSLPDMLDAREYGEMYWQSMRGAGLQPGDAGWGHPQYGNGPEPVIPEYILVKNNGGALGGAALEALKQSDPAAFAALVDPSSYDFATHQIVKSANTDWLGESFINAPQQSYQMNFSGGSDNGAYMLSLNYFNRKSTIAKTNFFKRYSLRSNASYNIGKHVQVGGNVQMSYHDMNTSLSGSSAGSSWNISPLIPVYDIMGNPASTFAPGTSGDGARNTVTESWRNRFDRIDRTGLFGNVFGSVNIIEGLTARTSFGFDLASGTVRDFTPITYEHAENSTSNQFRVAESRDFAWTWTNTLTYKRTFAEDHNFQILLGTEAIENLDRNTVGTRLNYPISQQDNPDFHVLDAGLGSQTNSGTFSRNMLYSLFSRVDYAYKDKYLLNATVRRDQSSKFAKDNRTGYFPAVAAGWRVSGENFMQGITWLDDLKLRASWGIIGNQTGLNNENQYNVYVSDLAQSYPVSGSNSSKSDSYTLSRIGNHLAGWEENITTNVGLDASFLGGTLSLTVDAYLKKVDGLLVQNQPAFTGATGGSSPTQPYINAGSMENRGIDIGVTKRGSISELQYEVGLMFSTYKNEVTKILDNPLATLVGGSTRIGNVSRTAVGMPVSMFYGYQIDGFFNSQAEVDAYLADGHSTWLAPAVGRWKIRDLNNDGDINGLDRTEIGNPHPDFQTSLNLTLRYKNFDLNAFFFWNQGGDIFNLNRYLTDFNSFNTNRSTRMMYESWTPELGNAAKLPKLDILDTYSNQNITDYFVEDASYLRLRNLQLGYSLPQSVLSHIKLDRLRVYVQAQNLFTLTKFTGMDPDGNLQGYESAGGGDLSMGISNRQTPTPKQVLFGIDFSF